MWAARAQVLAAPTTHDATLGLNKELILAVWFIGQKLYTSEDSNVPILRPLRNFQFQFH